MEKNSLDRNQYDLVPEGWTEKSAAKERNGS